MKQPAIVLCAIACVVAAHAEVLFEDSFEKPGSVRWQNSWGPAERSNEKAQDGEWGIKETLEDKYGLSVWFTELPAYPNATYRATAWVFVPGGEKAKTAALNFTRRDWTTLAGSTTDKTNEWVKLELVYENKSETFIRLQLFQGNAHQAGLGGRIMYWDNVTLEREIGETNVEDGIRINPYVVEGLDVTPAGGMTVKVAPGKINVAGQVVEVTEETVLDLAPPRIISVRDERATLTDQEPQGWGKGTPLKQCMGRGTGVEGCLDQASLVIKKAAGADAERFEEGVDWRADKPWARVGRLPDGAIAADTVVFMDYDFSLMRLDTIEVRSDGKVLLRRGNEHKMLPEAPKVDMYARALCNVYVPHHTTQLTVDSIYPIGPPFPGPTQTEIQRNAALIPASIDKLTAGGDFTLLFWGDSVTCGGDASSQATAFPEAFTKWLRNKYTAANIKYVNAGTGGWNSSIKLSLFEEEVIAKKPDLVVIEFVNDMGMDRETIFKNYTEAVSRIRAIGGEVIILTPHFVRPDWMSESGDMRTPETRVTIDYLKEFAAENNVGVADASRRWAHLWIEGLPYITLLLNTINHPDDRGHWLFVEELQKFFP